MFTQMCIFGSFFFFKLNTMSSNLKVSLEAFDFLKCSLSQFLTAGYKHLSGQILQELFAQLSPFHLP